MSNDVEFDTGPGLSSAPARSDSPIIQWIMKTFPGFIKEEKTAYVALLIVVLATIALSLFFAFKKDAAPYQPSKEEMFRVTPPASAPLQ